MYNFAKKWRRTNVFVVFLCILGVRGSPPDISNKVPHIVGPPTILGNYFQVVSLIWFGLIFDLSICMFIFCIVFGEHLWPFSKSLLSFQHFRVNFGVISTIILQMLQKSKHGIFCNRTMWFWRWRAIVFASSSFTSFGIVVSKWSSFSKPFSQTFEFQQNVLGLVEYADSAYMVSRSHHGQSPMQWCGELEKPRLLPPAPALGKTVAWWWVCCASWAASVGFIGFRMFSFCMFTSET